MRSPTTLAPLVALIGLVATWGRDLSLVVVLLVAGLLIGAVLAAVHHAEVVAHRVGEPLGSLVLAVAVTVIEVAPIITLMTSGGKDTSSLARDTVFAAVMITLNGIVGLALLIGSLRHHTLSFNAEGTGVLRVPAGLRSNRIVGGLPAVPVHPEHQAPRLLPAGHHRG